jgi:hypothetical protein
MPSLVCYERFFELVTTKITCLKNPSAKGTKALKLNEKLKNPKESYLALKAASLTCAVIKRPTCHPKMP